MKSKVELWGTAQRAGRTMQPSVTSVSEEEESSDRGEQPISTNTAPAWVWGQLSDDGSVTRNASFSHVAREADGANAHECSWESEPGNLCRAPCVQGRETLPADTGGTGLSKDV